MRLLRPLSVLLALATTAGLTLLTPGTATAAEQVWDVPDRATLVISGHGYGHGNGMSQHGAQGAARQGLTHRQIMEFYYPGTSWGRVRGKISVLLSADTTDDVVVMHRDGLRVRALDTGTLTALPRAERWRLTAGKGGRTVVKKFNGRRWRRFARMRGDAEFDAGGAPMALVLPDGGRVEYRGRLRSASPASGTRARDTVNVLTLEAYLRGVVPLEMPALWESEAVRSQAVAARTYAAFERAHPRARHYQVCDTTSCQVYGGASAEHPASNAAIRATRRTVLKADGGPAFTQFSASSGGWTSAGSRPYLVAQEDPYDDWAGNTHHDWKVEVGAAKIENTWPALGNLTQIRVTERDGNGEWGGRVRRIVFVGSRGKVSLTGDTVRFALGLKSTWFTFAVRK